jgi:hypothetical protein
MKSLSLGPACLGLILGVAFLIASAQADEADFLARFNGTFSGGGTVQRNAQEGPNKVTCSLIGQPTESGLSMNGACGAFIFSKQIRADLKFDEASGRYSGTYIGSSIGPARLSGKRNGNSVVLTITWPQPVNGDTKATMTIRNSGNGSLAITVTDEVSPGGPKAKVTQIALSQG